MSLIYNIGKGFGKKQMDVNTRAGMDKYIVRNDELFCTFKAGDETIEIRQDFPSPTDVVTILATKGLVRQTDTIRKDYYSSFLNGYLSAYRDLLLTGGLEVEDTNEETEDNA